MEELYFTVDSHLLRELGARLVGRPHIALAELVKNSYDADATEVVLRFTGDQIEVSDNGHGMNSAEFESRWLRIGTTHKEEQGVSRRFDRPLTGSKGVGRLAAQLLGDRLELRSTSNKRGPELVVNLDWRNAVEAGLLTEAPVFVDTISPETEYPQGSRKGTRLVISDLNQHWDATSFEKLAREIWPLQPPFRTGDSDAGERDFRVILESPFPSVVESFNEQMGAILRLWTARIVAEMLPVDAAPGGEVVFVERPLRLTGAERSSSEATWLTGEDFGLLEEDREVVPSRIVRLSLEFHDGERHTINYQLDACHLDTLDFEVRVFTLQHRQPQGIKVEEARNYLRTFGGVHVYDAGFHLPYYGPETDWLHVEMDHSHRLSTSKLLPEDLREREGARFLPTNSRLFGAVNVNTTHEQRHARVFGPTRERTALNIQVSRDRLADTAGFRDLVMMVRWALDFYANREKARAVERTLREQPVEEPTSRRVERVEEVLDRHRNAIPEETFESISEELGAAIEASKEEEARTEARLGLLGALATAGIAALAYEHEVAKQFDLLTSIRERLVEVGGDSDEFREIATALSQWLARATATRAMFSHLLEEENRESRARFRAGPLVAEVARQVDILLRGAVVDTSGVPSDLRVPEGGYAEWSALLQNVLINAINAMQNCESPRVDVSGGTDRSGSYLLLQDVGVGVDMDTAEELFDPFVRRLTLNRERSALGLGGSGLGLTIVRMISEQLKCRVRFVSPDAEHNTAVRIEWKDVE